MKWTNKGHQFDKMAEKLKSFRRIYIYGAGEIGKNVADRVSYLGVEIRFVDRDKNKQSAAINHYPVISPEEFVHEKNAYGDSFIVVFAVARYHYFYLSKYLLGDGYIENIDFFFYDIFLAVYLNILSVYKFNKVYIEQISQMVTTHCSLKCRDCIISIPYQKEKKHISLEQLKQDADLLFSKVDFVNYYGPGGGEIFLYPDLAQFLGYVVDNYLKQIGTVLLITNATVLPDEKVMKVIAENNLKIRISIYENFDGWKEKRDKFIALCDKYSIKYSEDKVDEWIDMGWNEQRALTILRAQTMFEQCDATCKGFADGVEHYCLQGQYANMARSISDENGETLNFRDLSTDKKVILEYNLGYSEKGYLGICGQCNGYFEINQKRIPVAEQL